jgi:hypothetical protein
MDKQASSASSVISLPQGGGALHGLGEKFAPDLFTGTGNFSVPIALPPGRNGLQPQLTLTYSTGNGNGPFGLGWSLSVPGVSRKTSHGIPRYNEHATADDSKRDVFLLSGSEDLVKVSGSYPGRVRYRPRTEGLFARIEHVRDETGNYWEVRTKDGLISRYGTKRSADITRTWSDPSVTRDPSSDNPDRIFSWKLTETRDPFGNAIVYDYLRDAGEQDAHRWDQPLLKRIRYVDYGDPANPAFLVHVDFDYEPRPDSFSDYRPGFETRTTLRCHTITITTYTMDRVAHKVREYRFIYEQDPHNGVSLLSQIEVFGFDDAGTISEKPVLPPLTYGYSRFEPDKRQFKSVTGQALPLPSLVTPDVDFVDLHGNGLPDVVEMNGVVRYWRNLGDGQFDLPRPMQDAPPHRLHDPGVQFIDANGDGRVDLLVTAVPLSGYYPMSDSPAWDRKSFQPYAQAPTVSFEDSEVKLLDLDGDGITDVLRSGSRFECFFNDPDPQRAWQRTAFVERQDLDRFPNVNFSDQRIRLADMTGDGLQDIAAIHDGHIDYWPNLGYGRWGRRIRMRHSPRFPFGYDPQHILLGDVDGDGLADLVYVDHGRVLLWINQSGNAWGEEPIMISGTPPMTSATAVRLVDLKGTGVSGLLWSRDANNGSTRDQLRFLDFTGGSKPYLLNRMNNNMGAETRVEYRPSTQDYLRDRQHPQTRWRTPLPFPVQVVDKVEVIDHISKTKLVTTYKYHHGYFDGREREFRGFGRVDQFDSETFEEFTNSSLHGSGDVFTNISSAYHVPPVETRSWFHTGIYFDEDHRAHVSTPFDYRELTNEFRKEFYRDDGEAVAIDEHEVATGETPHEAYRALRGAVLRTEVYANDGSAKAEHPYQVTENRYRVTQLQPKDGNHHTVYLSHPIESLSYHYERNPTDPRISHALTLAVDAFGNPLKSIAIGYGRRQPDPALPTQADRDKQTRTLITYTENSYTNSIDDPIFDPDNYRIPLPSETRTYELTGFKPADNAKRFSLGEWVEDDFARLKQSVEIKYEETADPSREQKRLIEHVRTRYRKNDLTALLPLGTIESLALPGESYKLAFTPGCLRRSMVTVSRIRCWPPMAPMFITKGMPTGGFPRGGFFTRRM